MSAWCTGLVAQPSSMLQVLVLVRTR
jgi:hypothetical protein